MLTSINTNIPFTFRLLLIVSFFFVGGLDGFGQFGEEYTITGQTNNPRSVCTFDLDGDGDMDMLSASQDDNKIAWHQNDGNGNFGSQQIITINANGAHSVYASDLDGDGDMDVLSASYLDDKIAWYQNDGNGNFGSQQIITINANSAHEVYASDLDGDGDMDVLSVSYLDDKIAWYQNDGNGNFGSQQIITTNADYPQSVYATDLDGDGDMDVLSASRLDNKIAWYQNDGNGNFGAQQIITINADWAISVYATDLDGDGDMDVLSASYLDNKIAWYQNDGNSNFGSQQIITTNANSVRSVYASDLDGDGDMDILSTASIGIIAWHQNDGTGNFGAQQIITISAKRTQSVYASDLDGDGDMDVLSASFNDDKIAWYENDGTGIFGIQQIITTNADGARYVYASDLDGDGDIDVLSASFNDDKIAWYENDGNGNFDTQLLITTDAREAQSVCASDLDGDGDIDVLSASRDDDKIAWYENDGNGNFGAQQIITTSADGAKSVYVSDLDGDGDIDVLSASEDDDKIAWYENDGNGNFGAQQIITTNADFANSVYATDLDGDGDMDVLSASRDDDKIAWYENDGNGNFGAQQIITINAAEAQSVYASDLDGDGDMDVLSASYDDDKIAWYENDGNGNFGAQQIITTVGDWASSVYAFDLDGDGDMDALAACRNDSKITWYQNKINEGCTDATACNYNVSFLIDDGSCCYDNCGCIEQDADNYNSSSTCNDGSCIYSGCTDNTACNFDFYANQDDGSCTFLGCINTNANNYDSLAGCDDFSCNYKIQGLVFFDENENGVFDGIDYGLSFQEITTSSNQVYLTNDEGIFYANSSSESIIFTLSANESFPYNTTSNPQSIVNGINTSTNDFSLNFGISSEIPDFAICLDFYPSGAGYPCDDWVNHNLCYRNMGNVPINGILEVEYDTLFQNYQEVTPIDSVVGNIIYMSFDSLMPGQMYFYDVSFHTPDFESIGEFLTSTGRVYGYYEGDEVAYGESTLVQEMTCSYDPNDKQVFPAGYEALHYVLPETRLEYLVRFQNTGNAPAINVLVTDTIDESLDLNSFELVANSHSVITTVKTEERVIEFLFENILLPDSTVNEPESHGLISYKLTPYDNLDYETEINNTAYIYFDNNPAIITNTTWTTIYDCNEGLAQIELSTNEVCSGEILNFQNTQEYVEDYRWLLDTIDLGMDSILTQAFSESGQFYIKLEVENPLCIATDSIDFFINPLPIIAFEGDFSLCQGESTTITATGGESYDWNGQGTESTLEITPITTTTYLVEAINEFECSDTDSVTVMVDPIPTLETSEDIALCEGESIILSASGGETYNWNGLGEESTLEVTPSETTTYEVEVTNEFECSDTDSVTVTVNPIPTAETSVDITLCQGESTTLTASGGETYDWNGLGEESMLEVNPSETTTYEVTVTNEFDCSDTEEVTVFINPLPTAEITADLITLTAVESATYQWYLNGNLIDGATSQAYTALENGNYSVEVTNEFDCSSISNEIIISVVGIEELSSEKIQLFPNPMQESSILYFGELGVNYQVKLFTIDGKLIRDYGQVTSGQLEIQRKGLSAGNYLVEVVDVTQGNKFAIQLAVE